MDQMKERFSKVAGVTHKDPQSGVKRQWLIKEYVHPGTKLIPQLEPDNPHDPNAVMLWLEIEKKSLFKLFSKEKMRFHLGYLRREMAADIAPVLRSGRPVYITVLEVSGGTKGQRTRGVNIVIRFPKK